MGELTQLPITPPSVRPVVESLAPPIRQGISPLLSKEPMDPSENIGDYLFRILEQTPLNPSNPQSKSGIVEFRNHQVPQSTYRGIISIIRYKQAGTTLGYVLFETLPTGKHCSILQNNDIQAFPGMPQSDHEAIVMLEKQNPWKDATEVVDVSCMLGDIDFPPPKGGILLPNPQAPLANAA